MDFTSFKNFPIDLVVIALVLLSGFFQKKYLDTIKISSAWKTLLVSAVFTIIYAVLIRLSGTYTKDLPVKWFFSYVTATSLYELLLKKYISKLFPDDAGTITNVVILLVMLLPMASCNTVHKSGQSLSTQSSMQHALQLDSAHVTLLHSNTTQSDIATLKKAVINEQKKALAIQFFDDSSVAYTPLIIEHVAGKTIINPGGRKLSSLEVLADSTSVVIDSSAKSAVVAMQMQKKDSASITVNDHTQATAATQEEAFVKSTFRFAGLSIGVMLVLILITIAAIWYVRNNTEILKKQI